MIFVDTSFFVAMLLARDRHHGAAVELAGRHATAGWLTTNHVIGETWTYLRRRAGHGPAVAFLDAVDASPRVHIVHIADDTEQDAAAWLRLHDEREYSYVDATSFATMRRQRLNTALAFDGDFAAAGFTELRT